MSEVTPRWMFYKIAKEFCHKDMLDELTDKEKHTIGQRLLYMCFPHSTNTSPEGKVTYGYGIVERNGFFEIPLTANDIKKMTLGTL